MRTRLTIAAATHPSPPRRTSFPGGMLLDIGSFALSRHAVSVASPQAATPGDYLNSRDRYICLRIMVTASVGRMQSAILLVPLPARLGAKKQAETRACTLVRPWPSYLGLTVHTRAH